MRVGDFYHIAGFQFRALQMLGKLTDDFDGQIQAAPPEYSMAKKFMQEQVRSYIPIPLRARLVQPQLSRDSAIISIELARTISTKAALFVISGVNHRILSEWGYSSARVC
jgi:hypothetical protein